MSDSTSSLALEFFPTTEKKHRKNRQKEQTEKLVRLEKLEDVVRLPLPRPVQPSDADKDCG